jgi:ABC-type Mn2+/Zn2+ transport system ATPase subunit
MEIKFKQFIKESDIRDIESTINNIPESHKKLIKNYEIKFDKENTLKKDSNHIGYINEKEKIINIASPWHYSKEFTLLHEIAHMVWKYILSDQQINDWNKITKTTKIKNISKKAIKSLNQNPEEIFCMAYANFYSRHTLLTYNSNKFNNFIKNIN